VRTDANKRRHKIARGTGTGGVIAGNIREGKNRGRKKECRRKNGEENRE